MNKFSVELSEKKNVQIYTDFPVRRIKILFTWWNSEQIEEISFFIWSLENFGFCIGISFALWKLNMIVILFRRRFMLENEN